MVRNTTHVLRGIAAVIDNTNTTSYNTIWVDAADVPKAIQQVGKLTDKSHPTVETGTHAVGKNHADRVFIRLD